MTAPLRRMRLALRARRQVRRTRGRAAAAAGGTAPRSGGSTAVRMALALLIVGGLYAGFAPGMQATAQDAPSQADIDRGKAIFDASCISCHGRNGQGVRTWDRA